MGGKGAVRVIFAMCRAPGGCARAVGIRVIGVWEAAHHLRAHSRRVQASVDPGENVDEMSRGVVSNAGIPPTSLTLSRQRRVSVPVEGGGQSSDAQLFICGN